jgi:hypothetical protein
MANLITHVYIAKQAFEKLPSEIQDKIAPCKDAFIFGSVGPDFLFTLRETGHKAGRFCNLMQFTKVYEVFSALKEYSTKSTNPYSIAYITGLMCHYVTDMLLHPFVYYFSEHDNHAKLLPTEQKQGIHQMIENTLDARIITDLMGYARPNDYNPNKEDLKLTLKAKREIANIYHSIIGDIVGCPVSKSAVRFSIFGLKFSMNAFTDKSGRKRNLFSKLENNVHSGKKTVRNMMRPAEYHDEIDFLNETHSEYLAVRNREGTLNHTAFEVVDNSINLSADYIVKFLSSEKLEREDYKVSYEGIETVTSDK